MKVSGVEVERQARMDRQIDWAFQESISLRPVSLKVDGSEATYFRTAIFISTSSLCL